MTMIWNARLALPLLAVALAGCADPGPAPGAGGDRDGERDAQFHADQQQWRRERREGLLQPHGWASLVGLHWLDLKAHYLGSSPGSGVRLALGPPRLGLVQREAGQAWFTPEAGVAVTADGEPVTGRTALRSDRRGAPTVIGFDGGRGHLTLIERGGREALRVRHADAPTRLGFGALEYWPADPAWRLPGRHVPNPGGATIEITDIIGSSSQMANPGRIEFSHQGVDYALEALEGENGALFVVLADRTSGQGSYPAGRFLTVAAPDAQGNVVLDFNRAYNPPCAFTAFATCPLPPAQNRLDLAITAGERAYAAPPG